MLESFYNKSPIWVQNLMVSGRGLEYRFRRANDRKTKEQFDFLLKSQWWDSERFQEYQIKSLQRILRVAFDNTIYFRKLKSDLDCYPEDFSSLDILERFPILEKSVLRSNEHNFLNLSINLNSCTHSFTSGTTGTPINIYESQDSFSQRMAFVSRLRQWVGLEDVLFPRRAQFTGRAIVPLSQKPNMHVYWRENIPGRSYLFSTSHLSPETVPYYAKALIEYKPELIDGYPSALLIIARISKRLKLDLPRPKAIIVTAETLLPENKEELETAFKCNVFNQYAASEPSCFWCECAYGVMHINPEYGISEIINEQGKAAVAGEHGEIVVTSFLNPVMPLIRYRIGDVAEVGSQKECKCGRKMPRIQKVIGRLDDVLFVPDRGYVGRLDPSFKGLSNIIEAQIVQESLNHIKILMIPDLNYNPEIGFQLIRNLRSKLGDQVIIEIVIVNEIARGANGKFRSVISKVKHLYPDRM